MWGSVAEGTGGGERRDGSRGKAIRQTPSRPLPRVASRFPACLLAVTRCIVAIFEFADPARFRGRPQCAKRMDRARVECSRRRVGNESLAGRRPVAARPGAATKGGPPKSH